MLRSERRPARERLIVILADPCSERRARLSRTAVEHEVVEAASLAEVYPLTEEIMPDFLLISRDLLPAPEFESVIRMSEMLGAGLVVYSEQATGRFLAPCGLKVSDVSIGAQDGLSQIMARTAAVANRMERRTGASGRPQLILIGASTGGVASLETVLGTFPEDCPPTLVVQHMREGFVSGLVHRFHRRCRPRIVEAEHQHPLLPGTVYFAGNTLRHLAILPGRTLRCALIDGPPRHGHRPAVDCLFESAVPVAARTAAALLTGMGRDGAAGLGALRRAGAFTIAQDQASSVVWGMPRAAVETGAASVVLSLQDIGPALLAPAQVTALQGASDV